MAKGSGMRLEIVMRPVERRDFDSWKPLWDGYNAFYGRSGDTALAEEITQQTWSRFFDGHEPVYALVAEEAGTGRLIGLVHYILHRSTISIGPVCYLQDLFTLEEVRGKGVGLSLIKAVYRRAERAGCSRVYWHTHATNAIARSLYDKVAEDSGFIVYRRML
jgi:GNAT superfamily N-acetyltransferase